MRAEEIAQRFALGGSARLSDGPVARGMQGEVWRLDTSDGRWAVKVPFRTVTEAGVALGTLLAEAAYARGVPTPLVRRTVEGDVLAVLAGGEPDATVRVHGWVDVLPPDDQLDPGLVGATVAAMHGLDVDVPAVLDGWHHEPVGATGWDELCVAARADGAPFAGRLVALRDELVALDAWVEPPGELHGCHRDLWSDNLRPTAGGGICVLDWDESGPADRSHELACVLFEFARRNAGRARELSTAYQQAGGPGRVTRRSDFSMLITELGHIMELAGWAWLRPDVPWLGPSAADAWISEGLDDPHTRAVLDRLLAASSTT